MYTGMSDEALGSVLFFIAISVVVGSMMLYYRFC